MLSRLPRTRDATECCRATGSGACRVCGSARALHVAAPRHRQPRGLHAVRAAADKAAAVDELRQSHAGLADRFAQVEADAKQDGSAKVEVPEGMTSGDEDLPEIEDITIDNYDEKVASAPVVIVDFYTQWCGPCKLMYPKLCEMQQEYLGKISFFKVNCNKSFKERGKELGIKVAPTFIFYKNGEHERMITGAKLDAIREALAELAA